MPSTEPGRTNRPFLLSRFRTLLSSLHGKTPYLSALPYASLEIIILVALVNILVWIIVAVVLRFYPHLSASSILAYSLGLRHALDADHISAIDLTTRRLLAVERGDSDQYESVKDGSAEVRAKKPKPVVTVGMWFSLGHSTIVILTTILVAATTAGISAHFDAFSTIGGIIGSSVSTGFLLLLGAINAWLLWKGIQGLKRVIKTERARIRSEGPGLSNSEKVLTNDTNKCHRSQHDSVNQQAQENRDIDIISIVSPPVQTEVAAKTTAGVTMPKPNSAVTITRPEETASNMETPKANANLTNQTAVDESLTLNLPNRSCLSSLLRWSLRLIDKPWKIYPLGVLFGLGFDTSSEIALIGITTLEASRGQSTSNSSGLGASDTGTGSLSAAAIWAILIFPLLFTAGMCLLDTTDGALMYALYSRTAPSLNSSANSPTSSVLASSYANVLLTGFTVFIALGVGILQMLNMLSNVLPEWRIDQSPAFWDGVATAGDRYDVIGGTICGMFLVVAVGGWAGYKRWRKWILTRESKHDGEGVIENELGNARGSGTVKIEDVV